MRPSLNSQHEINSAILESLGIKVRLDAVVIWFHGLQFEDEILQELEDHGFQLRAYFRRKPNSIRATLKNVYRGLGVPSSHLRHKLKYLHAMPTEHLVVFIINPNPHNQVQGQKDFRRLHSSHLTQWKWQMREKFNPRSESGMSHNHVLHASDTEAEAQQVLRMCDEGQDIWSRDTLLANEINPWLRHHRVDRFQNVRLDELTASILHGSRWQAERILTPVKETPHARAALGNPDSYSRYIHTFRGTGHKVAHSMHTFKLLAEKAQREGFRSLEPITVRVMSRGSFLVEDGLHRVAVALANGEDHLTAKVLA